MNGCNSGSRCSCTGRNSAGDLISEQWDKHSHTEGCRQIPEQSVSSCAMHLSAWTGKEVTLPLDDELYYELLMERVATSRRKENVKTVVSDLSDTYNSGK